MATAMAGYSGKVRTNPKDAPTTSISRFAKRTGPFTRVPYNETEKLRKPGSQSGMMATPTPIRAQMIGRLQHRNVALRSVSAACKLVAKGEATKTPVWNEFHCQVISAVSEAFNNIVLHGYEGRDDGVIEMEIHTRPDHISVELRDYGSSFDPRAAKEPELDSLPESGLGIFIIKSFMN